MKSFRQLLRQPLRTVMGVLLVSLAVSVLCVSLGQTLVAYQTERALSRTFQTAAFPAGNYTKENDDWVLSFAKENPKVVEAIHSPGLVSVYLPDLSPDNLVSYKSEYDSVHQYPQAMLVIRLTDIVPPVESVVEGIDGMIMTRTPNTWYQEANEEGILEWKQVPAYESICDERGFEIAATNYVDLSFKDISDSTRSLRTVSTQLTGVVEEVVGLEASYSSPVDYTASITLTVESTEEFNALGLKAGDRVLVYTLDYRDDWWKRNEFCRKLDIPLIQAFDPEDIHFYTEEEKHPSHLIATYNFGSWVHGLIEADLLEMRIVNLSASDPSAIPGATRNIDESAGPLWVMPGRLEYRDTNRYFYLPGGETPVYPVKEVISDQLTYTDSHGQTKTVPAEEYHARYARPTVARLDGSVEEFLNSPEGALWKQTLVDMDINNHAFPMIGVENLHYLPEFLKNSTRIIQGQDFTKEDLKKGSKVCIISEVLAEKNGLTVGDTIFPQMYEGDPDLPNQVTELLANPSALLYHSGTTQLEEPEAFTIVGIYQQTIPWDYSVVNPYVEYNPYCFTPNTIFTPKSALPDWQEEGFQGMFRTIILHGRGFQSFMETAAVSGLDEQLFYFDNGYSAIAESLESYRVIAGRVFAIGLTVYLILMVLYLLLYPAQQRKTMIAMERLGADRRRRMVQVELSSLGILIPGTVLGAILGALLWNRVVQVLLHTSGSSLAVEMSPWILAAVAAAQLIVMSLLTLTIAAPLSKSRGISDKR